MQVDAAQAGCLQDRARQEQAVGAHHREIRAPSAANSACASASFSVRGVRTSQPERTRRLVDRCPAQLVAAAGGARRLSIDGRDRVAGGEQRVEAGQDEAGRAHDDQPQAVRHASAGS